MSALDIGEGDAHIPSAVVVKPKESQMATITTKQRKALPSGKFADPKERKYPVHDKAHTDNAMARLEGEKSKLSPGKYASIKRRIRAAQRKFGEDTKASTGRGSFKLRLSHPDGSSTFVHHRLDAGNANAYFDCNTERFYHFVPVDKVVALSAGDANSRVWIQIARTGAWAGHPQGAFAITEATLDQMVANFYGQGFGRIPWDFEHISAMPANSGNLPVTGKPAQGWVYEMRREGGRLLALTEWKPLARQYIDDDQYQGVSPVIDWQAKDRVSAKPIGAMITSVALTQWPFISGMAQPTAASANGIDEQKTGIMPLTEVKNEQALSSAYGCHSALAMLPQLKSLFGLHELSTASDVATHLSMLRSHLDAVDGDGMATHEGVELAKYLAPLRVATNAHAGMDWYAVLDIVDELLDAYLDQHGLPDFEESHGEIPETDASAVATDTAASAQGIETMSEPVQAVAAEPVAVVEVIVPSPEPVNDTLLTAASAVVEPSPELAALTLKVAELTATISALSLENKTLLEQSNEAHDSALSAEVDAAILTYRDSKGLSEELRPHLLSMLKATPEAFRATYPSVEPDKQHLMLNLTGARVEADLPLETPEDKPDENATVIALGLQGLTNKLLAESGGKLSLGVAQLKADQILSAARAAIRK